MAFFGNAELKKVLELSDRTLKKVQKMVTKSRTLKSSRSSLKPLIVLSYNFFFRVYINVVDGIQRHEMFLVFSFLYFFRLLSFVLIVSLRYKKSFIRLIKSFFHDDRIEIT
jgi:hypothetical protein